MKAQGTGMTIMKQNGCTAAVCGGITLCEKVLGFLMEGRKMNEQTAEALCMECTSGAGVNLIWFAGSRIVQAYFSADDMYYFEQEYSEEFLEEEFLPEDAVQALSGENRTDAAVCIWAD